MARSRNSRDYPRASREYANGRSSRDHRSSSRGYNEKRKENNGNVRGAALPQYNHAGHKVTTGMHPDGESGRRGFNPLKFLVISGRSSSTLSMLVNMLWPIVPIAIALVRLFMKSMRECKLTIRTALCKAEMASRHLHHQLHRHVARRQSPGLRRSGAVSQDASEVHRCRRGNNFRFSR